MSSSNDTNSINTPAIKIVFIIFWLVILGFLIFLMTEVCNPSNIEQPSSQATDETKEHSTQEENSDNFTNSDNTFDYNENFEPNNSSDVADNAAPKEEVASQNVNFTPALDNSENLLKAVEQRKPGDDDDEEELVVEGTDALIAASSDRFYSIDTKGQTNRNASNDLRGDLPIAYNENYTPFNQSAIYGEPLIPAGRL